MQIALKYSLFALIATVLNIGSQDVSYRLVPLEQDQAVIASIIVGTGVGLVVKYLLDKRYIFRFQAQSLAHDGQTFLLYTIMGLATTAIFWGFEWGFHKAFASDMMRYLGGVIGLAIGYWAKYQLDKRFVFRQEALS